MRGSFNKKLIVIFLITIAANLNATVYRVNNNPGIDADFNSFSEAQSEANAGDTLYLGGSQVSYGNIVFTKPLVVIGPGYFLEDNPETQMNKNSAKLGTINFNSASEGSKIMGLEIQDEITVSTGNIDIRNNIIRSIVISASTDFQKLLIAQNYIVGAHSTGILGNGSSFVSGICITNNYISKGQFGGAISFNNNFSGVFSNNIFVGNVNVFNSTFSNNIQSYQSQTINNNTYFNNIGHEDQFPSGNGNQQYVNMEDIFVGETGNTTDGQWQLKTGSPAIGAGIDGSDCGIFGGQTPYVLSGMPPIPAVYEIKMPASGNSEEGINVNAKAKTH